ncbi:MAG TPA: MlaD family protein [Solirubrobacteraceae bacterium]|nr:MlaD family protein [Solirubrobacteraceae bacterium]
MNRRRPGGGPLQNRVLLGVVTSVVLIAGVVLAFQANTSLPFVSRYTLHLQVVNAEELTRGSEVHMGGSLIGFVTTVTPAHGPGGRPVADVTVQLDQSVGHLPRDTRFVIRLKGAIGSKFLDVQLGHSADSWPNGATVPPADTGAAVDLDQVLNTFDPPTRLGVARTTLGLGSALAGRGADVNAAIGAFVPLTRRLAPVMDLLAAPGTRLSGFISGLGALNGALAPVAAAQGHALNGLARTFTALASVAPDLARAIAGTPGALTAVTTDGARIDAFTGATADLLAQLDPGLATLPASAPVLADALAAGSRTLPGTIALDRRVTALARTLAGLSVSPTVEAGLSRLTLTAQSLHQPLGYLAPVQTGCDDITTTLHNLASTLSDNVGTGTVLRFVLVAIDDVTGGEAVPSHTPYLSTSTSGGSHHAPLHSDPTPYTDSPGQPALCSAGTEAYTPSHAQIGPS